MIDVKYVVYLDEFKFEIWPSKLLVKPSIGDWVESRRRKRLKVKAIMHSCELLNNEYVSRLILELGK